MDKELTTERKKLRNKIEKQLNRNGWHVIYHESDMKTPIIATDNVNAAINKLKDYVKKHKEFINKPFIVADIKAGIINKKYSLGVSFYPYVIDENYEFKIYMKSRYGKNITYPEDYLFKYGFKYSDLEKIYLALKKNPKLSAFLKSTTIEDVYKTLGKTPKPREEEVLIPAEMKKQMKKIKNRLDTNGRYRFYDPNDFNMPLVSSNDKDKVEKQLIKYVKKHAAAIDKVFVYADITIVNGASLSIVYKHCVVNSKHEIITKQDTTITFSNEYLRENEFKFAYIERLYVAATKGKIDAKNIKIETIDEIVRTWIKSFLPN